MGSISRWIKRHENEFSVEMNGYTDKYEGPYGSFLSTLPLIDLDGKILDLGSGNGMLLKFLMNFSKHNLIPYGVDINENAILRAKELLPDYKDNFFVDNVNRYEFKQGPFDIIITNPFYTISTVENYLTRCLDNLNNGGKIILRVHADVLEDKKINSISELEFSKTFNVKVAGGDGLELGIIKKH